MTTLNEFINAPSLTVVLQENVAEFSVLPTFSEISNILQEEANFFVDVEQVFSREVLLCLDKIPVVAARSICLPEDNYWRNILDCGNKSLGISLFDKKDEWKRNEFNFFTKHSLLHQRFKRLTNEFLAIRSSLFIHHKNQYLLITECFLPSLKSFGFL